MSFLHYLSAILFVFFSVEGDKTPSQKQNVQKQPSQAPAPSNNTHNSQRFGGGTGRTGPTKYGPIIIIEDTHYKQSD